MGSSGRRRLVPKKSENFKKQIRAEAERVAAANSPEKIRDKISNLESKLSRYDYNVCGYTYKMATVKRQLKSQIAALQERLYLMKMQKPKLRTSNLSPNSTVRDVAAEAQAQKHARTMMTKLEDALAEPQPPSKSK